MAVDVQQFLDRYKELETDKAPLLPILQLVAEYCDSTKADFTSQRQLGESYNDHLFDTTATKACRIAASAMVGLLWPNGGQSVVLEAEAPELEDDSDVKDWFDFVNKRMRLFLDDPRANLDNSLDEYMQEQLNFGTSGIMLDEGQKSMFSTKALSLRNMVIAEDEDGFCDTVFLKWEWTVRQIVRKYGLENVSEKTRKLFEAKKFGDKVKVIVGIYPNDDRNPQKQGNDNLYYKSVHVEEDAKHVLKDSGYHEFPAPIGRYRKKVGQKYGTSAGMDALPDVLEINQVKESLNVAREKTLDPALLVSDDGKMGGGIIDTSAGAINVVRVSGRAGNRPPIEPLFSVGDLNVAKEEIMELRDSIMGHYNVDRLLDLNNETEMTLGEAQMRDKLRADALRSVVGRQISELFTPLVERAFNILFRKGELGVARGSAEERVQLAMGRKPTYIPEAILNFAGKSDRVYRVKYMTPAARMMETQDATAVLELWAAALQIVKTDPNSDCLDLLDGDESLRIIQRVRGAPAGVLRDNKAVEAIRQARSEQAQQQAEMAQTQAAAQVSQDVATAKAVNQQVGV